MDKEKKKKMEQKNELTNKVIRRQAKNATYFVREPKMVQKKGHAYSIDQLKLMLTRAQEKENITVELILALCCWGRW